MKKYIFLLTILVIFALFSISVSAEDQVDEYISEFEGILPSQYSGLTEDSDGMLDKAGPGALFGEILAIIRGNGGEVVSFFLVLVGLLALISLSSLCPSNMSDAVEMVVSSMSSLLIFALLRPIFDSLQESCDRLCEFFAGLIPITAAINAAGGGIATASVQAGGMSAALSLVGGIGGRLVTAISSFALVMSLLSPFGGDNLLSVGKGVKSLFNWFIGILTALLTGALSLQTIISSATDSASIRTARYMASGLIPVVGSTVASALSTLASGLSYAKGIIGGGAIVVIILMAISPLVMLLLYRFALTLCILLSDFVGTSAAVRVFSSFRFAIDTLVAYYAISAMIFIFQIVLFIKVGVAAL